MSSDIAKRNPISWNWKFCPECGECFDADKESRCCDPTPKWRDVAPTEPGNYIHVSNWHWEVIEIVKGDDRKWPDDSEFYGPIPTPPGEGGEQ